MRGRSRLNRLNAVSWDMRTGMKVKASTIVEDGERPGLWVSRENADEQHPQRFVRPPGPDGDFWRPGAPALDYFMFVDTVTRMPWASSNYDQFPHMTLEFSRCHLVEELNVTSDIVTGPLLTLVAASYASGAAVDVITVDDFVLTASGSTFVPVDYISGGVKDLITINDFVLIPAAALTATRGGVRDVIDAGIWSGGSWGSGSWSSNPVTTSY